MGAEQADSFMEVASISYHTCIYFLSSTFTVNHLQNPTTFDLWTQNMYVFPQYMMLDARLIWCIVASGHLFKTVSLFYPHVVRCGGRAAHTVMLIRLTRDIL